MITNIKEFAHDANILFTKIYNNDPVTANHCRRVAEYAENYFRYSNKSKAEIQEITYAALLHDAGKLKIPDNILKSTKQYTPEERAIMNKHSEYGLDLLTPALSQSQILKDVMTHHHTSFDPDKEQGGHISELKGKNIPENARIIAVFDVYDALSRARMYKPEISQEDTFNKLQNDPKLDQDIVKNVIPFIKEYEQHQEKMELVQSETIVSKKAFGTDFETKIKDEFNKKIDKFLNSNDKQKYMTPTAEDIAILQWNTTMKNIIRTMPVAHNEIGKYDPTPVFDPSGKISRIEYVSEGTGDKIGRYDITQQDAQKTIKGISVVIDQRPDSKAQIKHLYKLASMLATPKTQNTDVMTQNTNNNDNKIKKSPNTVNTKSVLNKADNISNKQERVSYEIIC